MSTPYSTILVQPNTNDYNFIGSKHLFRVISNTQSILSSTVLNNIIYNNESNYIDALSISSTGYVGIGNSNPTYNLDVSNTAYLKNIIGNGSSISNINASNLTIGTLNASRLPTVSSVVGSYGLGLPNQTTNTNTVTLTVDTYGRIVSISNVTSSITNSQVSSLSNSASIDTTNAINVKYGTLNTSILSIVSSIHTGDSSGINSINASNIVLGTVNTSILPLIPQLTSGTYGTTRMINFVVDKYGRINTITEIIASETSASNLTIGTLNASRLPTISSVIGSYGLGLPNQTTNTNTVTLTVDTYGRIVSVTNVTISITNNQVSSLSNSASIDTTNAINVKYGTLNTSILSIVSSIHTGDSSGINSINASNIVLGTVNTSILPLIPQLTSGTYGTTRMINFVVDKYGRINTITEIIASETSASNLTIGTLNASRLPTISSVIGSYGLGLPNQTTNTNTVTLTVDTYGRIVSVTNVTISITNNQVSSLSNSASIDTTNAVNIKYGTLSSALLPSTINTTLQGSGEGLSNINISNINSSLGTLVSSVLNISGVTSGTYGTGSSTYNLNVDNYGRITSISINSIQISGINASNLTTGTLNASRLPTIAGSSGTYGSSQNTISLSIDTYGRVVSIQNNSTIPQFSYTLISGLSKSATIDTTNASNVTTGTLSTSLINTFTALYLTGDGSSISNINLSSANLNTQILLSQYSTSGVTSGTYGSASSTVNFVIDKYGRILSASSTTYINNSISNIAFSGSISNTVFPTTLNNYSVTNSSANSTARNYSTTTRLKSSKLITIPLTSPTSTDIYGSAVAISANGNVIVSGASGYSGNGYSGAGAIVIGTYSYTSGSYVPTIPFYSANANERFGYAVDISNDGTLVAITSYGSGNQNLYVTKYVNGSWGSLLKIANATSTVTSVIPFGLGLSNGKNFGYTVSIIDNSLTSNPNYIILVGTNSSTLLGSVYQFITTDITNAQTWSFLPISYTATSLSTTNDRFGSFIYNAPLITNISPKIYPQYGFTIIGANQSQVSSVSVGAIYIYQNIATVSGGNVTGTSASEILRITGSDIILNDKFGSSVAGVQYDNISYVVVGAPSKANNRGQVYLYYSSSNTFTSYTQIIITALDAVDGDLFGQTVQITNFSYNNYNSSYSYNKNRRVLLIGAPGANSLAGKVYVYTLDQDLTNNNVVAYYDFTYIPTAVAGQQVGFWISKASIYNTILVGAPNNGGGVTNVGGSFYITQLQLYDATSFVPQLTIDTYGRVTNTSIIIPPFPSTIIYNLGNSATTSMNTVNIIGTTVSTSINIGNAAAFYANTSFSTTINGSTINFSSSNITINNLLGTYTLPKYTTGKFTNLSSVPLTFSITSFNVCIIRLNISLGSTTAITGITISGTNSTSVVISVSNPQERFIPYSTNGYVLHAATGKIFDVNASTSTSENYFTEIKIINNNNSSGYYFMTKTVYRRTSPAGTSKVYTSGYLNSTTALTNLILTPATGTLSGTWTMIYN